MLEHRFFFFFNDHIDHMILSVFLQIAELDYELVLRSVGATRPGSIKETLKTDQIQNVVPEAAAKGSPEVPKQKNWFEKLFGL